MKRLETLDGVRGVLAVYVLLGHLAPFTVSPDWLQNAVSHGGAAVDLFFVLSGLVISQSLSHAGGRVWPFLIARTARIFPVFLVVFTVSVAVQPWSCGFEHMPWISPSNPARSICVMAWPHAWAAEIAAHLTMTHRLFPAAVLPDVWVSFLGAAWSLSTEWQFYLLALVGACRCRSSGACYRASPKQIESELSMSGSRQPAGPLHAAAAFSGKTLCRVLLALAVAGVVWQWTAPQAWQFSRAFLPNQAHFFALGVASVPVLRLRDRASRHDVLGRYLLVLLASLAVCSLQGSPGKMLPPLIWTFFLMVQIWPEAAGLRLAGALLRSRIASYLGTISYCLYLVNEPVHKLAGSVLSRLVDGDSAWFTALWIPVAIGMPLLVSAWLHVHLEAPAQRWGRRVAQRKASSMTRNTFPAHEVDVAAEPTGALSSQAGLRSAAG